jgi:hypothetical protein
MRYVTIEPTSLSDAEAALVSGDSAAAAIAVVAVGLHCDDLSVALQFLVKAAESDDPSVRGNAVLSFGHLARRFRTLPVNPVKALVEQGLADRDEWVRGQAYAAAGDIEHFLGWVLERRGDA